MKYILTFVRNGQTTYHPHIVGDYDFVHKVASSYAPGLMAHAVSYAHYLGHSGQFRASHFTKDEKAHYLSGITSRRRACQVSMQEVSHVSV